MQLKDADEILRQLIDAADKARIPTFLAPTNGGSVSKPTRTPTDMSKVEAEQFVLERNKLNRSASSTNSKTPKSKDQGGESDGAKKAAIGTRQHAVDQRIRTLRENVVETWREYLLLPDKATVDKTKLRQLNNQLDTIVGRAMKPLSDQDILQCFESSHLQYLDVLISYFDGHKYTTSLGLRALSEEVSAT